MSGKSVRNLNQAYIRAGEIYWNAQLRNKKNPLCLEHALFRNERFFGFKTFWNTTVKKIDLSS
jgi:hypothetical protein